MNSVASFWTAERDQVLIRLMAENYTALEAARVLNTSRNAVIGRVHRIEANAKTRMERRKPPYTVKPRVTQAGSDGGVTLKRKYVRTVAPGNLHGKNASTAQARVTLAASAALMAGRTAAPVAPTPPAPAPAEPTGKPVTLLRLAKTGCRYGVAEDRHGRHLFCNAERLAGKSYCAFHQPLTVAEYGPRLVKETLRKVKGLI